MIKKKHFKIATRQSALALAQTEWVKKKLEKHNPDLSFEIKPFITQGDQHLKSTLSKIGGKGLFVKELEQALLAKEVDFAVHSVKDLPTESPKGLMLGAVLSRDHPFDVLVSPTHKKLLELPQKSVIGTSSLRRQTQLHYLRSDLKFRLLRGNIETRLKKLDDGGFDAIVLAEAGLLRLKLQNRITEVFSVDKIVPAVGQGALGVECRSADKTTKALLSSIDDHKLACCLKAERAFNKVLGGDCHTPIGAFARIQSKTIVITGAIGTLNPREQLRGSLRGLPEQAEQLGGALAHKFLSQGARKLLDAFIGS